MFTLRPELQITADQIQTLSPLFMLKRLKIQDLRVKVMSGITLKQPVRGAGFGIRPRGDKVHVKTAVYCEFSFLDTSGIYVLRCPAYYSI